MASLSFRLTEEESAALDAHAEALGLEHGGLPSRPKAIRRWIRRELMGAAPTDGKISTSDAKAKLQGLLDELVDGLQGDGRQVREGLAEQLASALLAARSI